MVNISRIKVALVKPPIAGHKFRGTGVYGEELYESLKKEKVIDVSWVNYSDDLSKFTLVHYPYFDPFFLTLPLIKTKPTVVTVHDLIPLNFPSEFPRGIRGEIKWFIQRLSLRGARAVITDSFASQNDIAKFTGIEKEKIHVIYLGVNKQFRKIEKISVLKKLKEKYQLPDKFLLYVGDINYNKNIPGLIKSFWHVARKYNDLYLILIGKGFVEDSPQLSKVKELISYLKLEERVRRLGYIETQALVAVYNLAQVYLQLSFAEGFGLPVLEAMACGCPVICSRNSSLKEIGQDAALFVTPSLEEEVVQNIEKVLENKNIWQKMSEKGLKRAKKFSWDKCAIQTVELYKQVIH